MRYKMMKEKIRNFTIIWARKNKLFRICIIGFLAVKLFLRHLISNRKWQWKKSLAMAASIVIVLVVIYPAETDKAGIFNEVTLTEQLPAEAATTRKQTNKLSSQNNDEISGGEVEIPLVTDEEGLTQEIQPTDILPESTDQGNIEPDGAAEGEESLTEPENDTDMSEQQENMAETNGEPGESDDESALEPDSGRAEQTVSGNDSENVEDTEENIKEENTVSGNEGDVSGSDSISDIDSVSDNESEDMPQLSIISRNGGELNEGVFFAVSGAWYEVAVSGEKDVSGGDNLQNPSGTVFYQMNEQKYTAEIKDGKAIVTLPDQAEGQLLIWCDQNQEELSEYIVVEQEAPEVTSTVVEGEEHLSYAEVVIAETGEIVSGIKEYSFLLDGESIDLQPMEDNAVTLDAEWGEWSPSQLTFSLPLMDMKEHELKVYAQDYAGNVTEEVYQVMAEPQGVVSVVLPTSFDISMYPAGEEPGTIKSSDIIICNKSVFPINVVVKTTTVNIDSDKDTEGKEKNCDINLELLEAEQEKKTVMLQEGEQSDLMTFRLETVSLKTDPDELLTQAAEKKHLKLIHSDDYAAMRLTGSMSAADWKDGDLKVKIVFDFKRADMLEETEK